MRRVSPKSRWAAGSALARMGGVLGVVVAASCVGVGSQEPSPLEPSTVSVTTVAVRVHDMEAMVAFYSEAFGMRFRDVETFGLASRFGRLGNLELKFVPLRESSEFEEYPSHQLGVAVPDVARVLALATQHGGRIEGDVRHVEGRVHAAVRDPDGNTLELYGPSVGGVGGVGGVKSASGH